MRSDTRDKRRPVHHGIPEFDSTRHDDVSDAMEETAKGVVNTFTVERDTSLADGAGAPGSTDVGGFGRDEADAQAPPAQRNRS